jgi:hypothetical protein
MRPLDQSSNATEYKAPEKLYTSSHECVGVFKIVENKKKWKSPPWPTKAIFSNIYDVLILVGRISAIGSDTDPRKLVVGGKSHYFVPNEHIFINVACKGLGYFGLSDVVPGVLDI